MRELELHTAEGIVLRRELAGAGSRMAAGLVDLALVASLLLTLVLLLQMLAAVDVTGVSSFALGFASLGALLLVVLYQGLVHVAGGGRSPGKATLGLRVVSADGQPATGFQLVLRGLVWLVDALVLVPVPIGLVVISLTPRRQRLGDLAAGTLVVRERRSDASLEPWEKERWSTLQRRTLALTPGAAARFDAEDLAFLRALVTRRGIAAPARDRLYRDAARHFLARAGLPESGDVRAALKELYLFLREQRR